MRNKSSRVIVLLAATPLFCIGTLVSAQSRPVQDDRPVADNDTTRAELTRFDQFLDSHREIAEQLRKDPSLANNSEFLKTHPALQTFMQDQPGVRAEMKEDPNRFMREEDAFNRGEDRTGNDARRQQLADFHQFLDVHREVAEQLRRDPSLADNEQYLMDHPELQTFLRDQPGVREQLRQDPNAFMREEDAFDRGGERTDNDPRRRELAQFSQFLDSHREIAEQLQKDPSLADKEGFLKTHPALQTFEQDQPGIREQLRQDPNAFMREEDAFNRSQEGGHDARYDHLASFKGFLDGHTNISDELSKNPGLVKDHDYMNNRPELRAYLNGNPEVRDELMANPQVFVNAEQQFNKDPQNYNNSGGWSPKTQTTTPAPAPNHNAAPKQ